jgi:hypothetical protein
MEKDKFHIEAAIMVASTAVTAGGTKKYLEKYVTDLVARGIYTRIAWLTGSHGMETGQDGMNSLECLSDAIQQRNGRSQTRMFYERWCHFLSLPVEGRDPRVYDPTTGLVIGIRNVLTPDWAARKPGRVPGLYKNMKGEISELEIQIIDIAHYHGKHKELIEVVKKFQPSTLIIDWCFTRGGNTAQKLTAGGFISRIILENELSIITGRGWIKLSKEQKKVMDDIEQMEMAGDGSHHDGSIVFMQGSYGSGKTVLGIEAGRVLRSKRQQMNTDKEVELTFCAPYGYAHNLLESLREKYFNIEKIGNITTVEEIFRMYQLGEFNFSVYKDTLSTLAKIGQALSQSGKQHVIILDELRYTQDYRKIRKYANVDMVILAKANWNGKKDILPPASDTTVRVHELSTSYRQSWDAFMAHKYIMTHVYSAYSLSAAAAMVPDGERCPPGQRTVWVNCKEGVEVVTALETVKKVLDDDRKRTDSTDDVDCQDHVTVLYRHDDKISEAGRKFCAEQGWTWPDRKYNACGYEDDVIYRILL